MPPREQFPTKALDDAPSNDIGWHFGTPEPGSRNNVRCKLCNSVIKGGITRLKQHIAHMKGQVTGCGRVTTMVRENMMKLLLDSKAKRNDSKKRKEEFEERLRGDVEDEDEDVDALIDDQLRYATQQSLRSHQEWENMQQFRRETRASENVYEQGGSSRASVSGGGRPEDISFSLRSTNIDLQNVSLEDSSSSSIAHSFNDFVIGDSSQSSQQSYPPVYQYPYSNSYNQYPSDQAPPYYQQSMNDHNLYHQQSNGDFFGYVFGQGATQDDSQSESTSYAPSRHSTMW